MNERPVIIRLSKAQADLVWRNADGWMDAGACEGGLTKDEMAALSSLNSQISRQIHKIRKA